MTVIISIGMPVYNGERWLAQAIGSILSQTHSDFELIISDNASSDGTAAICQRYLRADTRIRYYRQSENIGASDNYNAVYRYSTGSYFKWASCNDTCAPTFLASCIAVLNRQPSVTLCYPRTLLVDDAAGTTEQYQDGLHLMDDAPCKRFTRLLSSIRLNNAMNGVIRSSALAQTKLIKTHFASDIIMMAELALHGKFFEVPEFLYHRRMDPQTATRMKSAEQVLEHYYPKRDNRMLFQHWRINAGYFGAVARAPISLMQKFICYRHLFRQIIWSRRDLYEDMLAVLPRSGS